VAALGGEFGRRARAEIGLVDVVDDDVDVVLGAPFLGPLVVPGVVLRDEVAPEQDLDWLLLPPPPPPPLPPPAQAARIGATPADPATIKPLRVRKSRRDRPSVVGAESCLSSSIRPPDDVEVHTRGCTPMDVRGRESRL